MQASASLFKHRSAFGSYQFVLLLVIFLGGELGAADSEAIKPSPLDRFKSSDIPPKSRFNNQPKELVAIFGKPGSTNVFVYGVAFSPDGAWLAWGENRATETSKYAVRLLDTASSREIALGGQDHWVTTVTFSPGSKILAAGGEGSIRLWKLGAGKAQIWATLNVPALFGSKGGNVQSMAFSPDSKKLACCADGQIAVLFDLSREKPKEWDSIAGHTEVVKSVAFAPFDTILATASWDQSVRLWDLSRDKYKEVMVLKGEQFFLAKAATFSPVGKILATATTDTIRLWDIANEKPKELLALEGHRKPLTSIGFSPDGKTLVSADSQGRLLLWDVVTGAKTKEWEFADGIQSVAFAPDGRHLAATNRGVVYLLRLKEAMPETKPTN
jgi:WD40 repeat protein